jgi:transcriptional regulator with XRE-family HTH domain
MMWGERIKELRTAAGISKYRLAREVGTSEEYLRLLEKGVVNPSIERLELILEKVGYRLTIEKVE